VKQGVGKRLRGQKGRLRKSGIYNVIHLRGESQNQARDAQKKEQNPTQSTGDTNYDLGSLRGEKGRGGQSDKTLKIQGAVQPSKTNPGHSGNKVKRKGRNGESCDVLAKSLSKSGKADRPKGNTFTSERPLKCKWRTLLRLSRIDFTSRVSSREVRLKAPNSGGNSSGSKHREKLQADKDPRGTASKEIKIDHRVPSVPQKKSEKGQLGMGGGGTKGRNAVLHPNSDKIGEWQEVEHCLRTNTDRIGKGEVSVLVCRII